MQGLKDCLKINWAWKQKPYSLPEVLIRSNFSKMIWTNKTKFIFRLGNYTMNVLYPALSKSFALNISSRDMKTQPWDIFARKCITKCVVGCNHDGSLEMITVFSSSSWSFSSTRCVTYFIRQNLQIFTKKVTS